jgi:hypothetical protein
MGSFQDKQAAKALEAKVKADEAEISRLKRMGPWDVRVTTSRDEMVSMVSWNWDLLSSTTSMLGGTLAYTEYVLRRPNPYYVAA